MVSASYLKKGAKGAILAGVLVLTSCSSTTFLYNRLDFLLPWYLGKYVSLQREQKQELDRLLRPYLAWHRSEELPEYLLVVQEVETSLDGDLSAQQIGNIAAQFEEAWFRLEAKTVDWMLVLGAMLSDKQISRFLDKLQEKQEEYEKEYLSRSDDEYFEEAYKDLRDSTQDYIGRLSKNQISLLQAAAGRLDRSDDIWLQERAIWIERLGAILTNRAEGWQQQVLDALTERDETVSEQYTQAIERNSQEIFSVLAQVLNERSEKQDQRLRRKLKNLRDDIQTLIDQT